MEKMEFVELKNKLLSVEFDPHFPSPSILCQHMNEQNVLNAVKIEKDVDGFHPLNIGCLAMRDRDPLFVPCTPKGCIELLHRYNVPMKGKRAVVIGRSNIVGMPAALLLQVMSLCFKFVFNSVHRSTFILNVILYSSLMCSMFTYSSVSVSRIIRGKMLLSVLSTPEPIVLRRSQDRPIY